MPGTANTNPLSALADCVRVHFPQFHKNNDCDITNPMRIRRFSKAPPIGGLEVKVLTCTWDSDDDVSAQSLHDALQDQGVSLSTIQTTLKRLHRKGLLSRSRIGHAFHYRAAVRREELISRMIEDVSFQLAEGDLQPVLSGFFDLIDKTDPDLRARMQAASDREGQDE